MTRKPSKQMVAFVLAGVALLLLDPGTGLPQAKKAKTDPLVARLAATSVAAGREFRALLLYPIRADGQPEKTKLPQNTVEALKSDNLSIAQSLPAGAAVDLVFYNWSLRPILVLSGEAFVGGSRERWVDHDVLVPPGRKVATHAYPAALDPLRRDARSRMLVPMGSLVPPRYRLMGLKKATIAKELDALQKDLADAGVKGGRRTLPQLLARKEIADRVAEYQRMYRLEFNAKSDRTVGVVAFVGGTLVEADVFPTHDAFLSEWRPVLKSLALEATLFELRTGHLDDPSFRLGKDSDRFRGVARAFIQRAFGAQFEKRQNPGAGLLETFSGSHLVAEVLSSKGRLVHGLLMPPAIDLPTHVTNPTKQPKPPPPNPDEYTRGELERKAARGTLTQAEKRILKRMRERDSTGPARTAPSAPAPNRPSPPSSGGSRTPSGSVPGAGQGQGVLPPH